MPLINCKFELSLTWGEQCILSGDALNDTGVVQNAGTGATFKITDEKLYVPEVTLLTQENVKLTKQLNDGFKRFVYWDKYKIIPNKKEEPPNNNDPAYIRELLDASYQGPQRLFIFAYDDSNENSGVKVDTYTKKFPSNSKCKKLQH